MKPQGRKYLRPDAIPSVYRPPSSSPSTCSAPETFDAMRSADADTFEMSGQGSSEAVEVKVEEVDVSEQFIDGNDIHCRSEYVIKSESGTNNLFGGLLEEKIPPDLKNISATQEYNEKLNEADPVTGKQIWRHIDKISSKCRQLKCDSCEYTTSYDGNLKRHIDTVHLRCKKYDCSLCDYATNSLASLTRHTDSVHLNLKEHKCQFCEFATNTKTGLKRHTDSVHLNSKNHKCHLCEYESNRKSCLRIHIESVHLKLKRYKCNSCDYATNSLSSLYKHSDSRHLNMRQYKCKFCEYASNTKPTLKQHIDSIHLKHNKSQLYR